MIDMDNITTVLNLGAGVQSTTLLLMMVRGDMPFADHIIFSDTRWETTRTYAHLLWLRGVVENSGRKIHTVSNGNIRDLHADYWISLPVFVKGKGMMKRQCTSHFKINPINKYIRNNILGLKKRQRAKKDIVVKQIFGITADEASRMKPSRYYWTEHVYPFCNHPYNYFPKELTRKDCIEWLREHYPALDVPRSACIGCPYKSDEEWRDMKKNDPASWSDAVAYDKELRTVINNNIFTSLDDFSVYLHRSRRPLDEVDLRTDVDKGQGLLWNNECEGMCGV